MERQEVLNYLVENKFVNDVESADQMVDHLSNDMLNEIAAAAGAVARLAPMAARGLAGAGKMGAAKKAVSVGKTAGNISSGIDTAKTVGSTAKSAMQHVIPRDSKTVSTTEELEIVCDHLIDEGFVDTGVEAENIFHHMSEEWKQHILQSHGG